MNVETSALGTSWLVKGLLKEYRVKLVFLILANCKLHQLLLQEEIFTARVKKCVEVIQVEKQTKSSQECPRN